MRLLGCRVRPGQLPAAVPCAVQVWRTLTSPVTDESLHDESRGEPRSGTPQFPVQHGW